MPIQIIIFITKTKISASEINSSGKAETVSINGNPEIKCEGKESADELIECLCDAYNIDDFADDNFDIIILEGDADREVIKHLETKCSGAIKFNIISMEKILPVIASAKNLIKAGKEIVLTFADQFYKISCDNNGLIKISTGDKDTKAMMLNQDDFAVIFHYKLGENIDSDAKKVLKFEKEVKKYKQTILDLNNKVTDLQKELQEAKNALSSKIKINVTKIQDKNTSDFANDLAEILQKHRTIFENTPEYEGEFYINGAIPSSKFPRNMLNYNQVSTSAYAYLLRFSNETSLAIYCLANSRDDKSLRYLLVTKDGILYYTDFSGEAGFVYWDKIRSIDYENIFNNIYISISLTNGRDIRFCGIDKSLKNKNTTQKFLFNLLTDFERLKTQLKESR